MSPLAQQPSPQPRTRPPGRRSLGGSWARCSAGAGRWPRSGHSPWLWAGRSGWSRAWRRRTSGWHRPWRRWNGPWRAGRPACAGWWRRCRGPQRWRGHTGRGTWGCGGCGPSRRCPWWAGSPAVWTGTSAGRAGRTSAEGGGRRRSRWGWIQTRRCNLASEWQPCCWGKEGGIPIGRNSESLMSPLQDFLQRLLHLFKPWSVHLHNNVQNKGLPCGLNRTTLIFTGRTDAEAETPRLWPPDAKSWLIAKDPNAGKDWGQEKRATEDEMAGWHHWLNGHEFEQTLGDSEGQGSLVCCSPWGRKVRHDLVTEQQQHASKVLSTGPGTQYELNKFSLLLLYF